MKKQPTTEINIDDIDLNAEAIEIIADDAVTIVEDTKQPKSNAKSIIDELKRNAPEFPVWDNMTPKDLDAIFAMSDQGRTVRRYLRKYFSDNHIHKTSWNLTKHEANAVIAYLSTKLGEPHFNTEEEEA